MFWFSLHFQTLFHLFVPILHPRHIFRHFPSLAIALPIRRTFHPFQITSFRFLRCIFFHINPVQIPCHAATSFRVFHVLVSAIYHSYIPGLIFVHLFTSLCLRFATVTSPTLSLYTFSHPVSFHFHSLYCTFQFVYMSL